MFSPELFEFTSPLGTYFDAFPVHVLTTRRSRPAARRPSGLIVGGSAPTRWSRRRERAGLIDPTWSGRSLRIGDAVVQVQMPTARCSMTIRSQPGLPDDPLVLRAIVRDADQNLGVYATVAAPGNVRVGDPVELV
jgi:hypothetical protein